MHCRKRRFQSNGLFYGRFGYLNEYAVKNGGKFEFEWVELINSEKSLLVQDKKVSTCIGYSTTEMTAGLTAQLRK